MNIKDSTVYDMKIYIYEVLENELYKYFTNGYFETDGYSERPQQQAEINKMKALVYSTTSRNWQDEGISIRKPQNYTFCELGKEFANLFLNYSVSFLFC